MELRPRLIADPVVLSEAVRAEGDSKRNPPTHLPTLTIGRQHGKEIKAIWRFSDRDQSDVWWRDGETSSSKRTNNEPVNSCGENQV